ncbi:PAS domain S-box protein [Halomicronema sp. CCY15110]|uniref:PAS domain S-box protein n=1 Tax=Halomicronema sp. CCY15110 TaxID=2767773 RepID=UPI0019510F08|nr:PAS domain S-box protein [Halomicronema sp. CCY15110]
MTSAKPPKVSSDQKVKNLNSESDSLFRTYVEAASDIVYTLDLTGKFTFVNAYGLKLIGANEDEVVGHSYLEIVAPEYRGKTFEVFAQLLKSGELRDYEFVVLTRSGDRVFIEVNGRLLYRSGRLVGALGIGRDITERKRFEAQLKMFSKALDSAHDSAIITDLKGHIQYANLATQRLFNWPVSRLTGTNIANFFPNADQVDWILEQANGPGWSGQIVCQRYDGTPFSAFISISPVYGEDNQTLTSVSIILRDITQQERIEAELAAKNLELARANRLKSEFLANMSHELRTPMTSILGFSKLLSQLVYGDLNERQQLYVDQIHQSGEHLLSLINEVLDLSKVEAGQMDLSIAEIHLGSLCNDVVKMVETQAGMKALKIQCEVPVDLPMLVADEIRVRQMLLNLLSNAIKFTPKGRAIGIRVNQVAEQMQLTVWDEGIGISEAQLSSLFQPFQQLENPLSKHYEGTGLGLALTQKLTRLHGGDVTVKSRPNQGSEFTLHLPMNCRHATLRDGHHAVQDATLAHQTSTQPPTPSITQPILVVEDNSMNAMLLQHMLTHWGYQVHHCANSQEALTWLEGHHPALVLMDVQLPGLSGLDLTQQIHQQPQWQDIPIVATTALAQPQDRDRCLAAGMQGYLSKPINHAELVSILAKYTCGHKA